MFKAMFKMLFYLDYIVFITIGSQDHNRKYNYMTLCMFYSVDHGGESRITAGLRKYPHQLTLDLNTVNKHLSLSEDKREITVSSTDQPYPDHPDRFDVFEQVLCEESVCGRCYWELERGGGEAYVSVSYKSISRKGRGDECRFGSNDQSWSLVCSPFTFSFRHNNIETALSVEPSSCSRIGVYVDHSAGTLSFYSVSDTTTLIHTVQTTFTEPLYPGFYIIYPGSSVKLLMNQKTLSGDSTHNALSCMINQ
ncbi:hypothetical protein G5714_004380 [Onychostoma macrolepis]|uniref:B30.2/SPRY domain-containing protein n=1 Tax=Onychostoma macrolepis TaxID=369639 RepID=A0A7J6D4L0_9TELE|nr:hypothetical protein G5714_004380 [Onychostoma macrolepis]